MTYTGFGSKSNSNNYNPAYNLDILVISEEFYKQFQDTWTVSFALSYVRQNEYLDDYQYEKESKTVKEEFRAYRRRLSKAIKAGKITLTPSHLIRNENIFW